MIIETEIDALINVNNVVKKCIQIGCINDKKLLFDLENASKLADYLLKVKNGKKKNSRNTNK